ncbi:Glucanosyltransferase-domain-containing protein [Mycena leptocephala]|nr:Glucanosyltransferase-domain-containing protein [Mycena leptocephala]
MASGGVASATGLDTLTFPSSIVTDDCGSSHFHHTVDIDPQQDVTFTSSTQCAKSLGDDSRPAEIEMTASHSITKKILECIDAINVFTKYDNLLAFNLGNEVLNVSMTAAAPFLKAAARDIKAYLTTISSPALVSYAAVDADATFIAAVADPSETNSGRTSIDMFGLNNYERCGNVASAVYEPVNTALQDYNVVAYLCVRPDSSIPPIHR